MLILSYLHLLTVDDDNALYMLVAFWSPIPLTFLFFGIYQPKHASAMRRTLLELPFPRGWIMLLLGESLHTDLHT
jgi:hypothetical protein